MEEIGLQLVLQGLDIFTQGLSQAKSSMMDILQQPSLLQDAFSALGGSLGDFADWVGNVLTYTIGGLLKDAFEAVISVIGDLVSSTVDAGNAFQVLSIRLDGINFNDPTTNLAQYSDGIQRAKELTKEQIQWIQQMAIITPFSAEGIASVYTMQRAMGDTDGQAKDLTVSITNWAAGMGMSEESVTRLSNALGKATAAGKVDGITMRALRSEFVPIPAVLQQMADDLGTTTDKLAEMQKKGELAPLPFIKAFEEVANKRFPDAANALAHTWQGAMNNIVDIFSNFGGENIVKPILDVLGKVAGGIVDVFARMTDHGPEFTDLGKKLMDTSISIGNSISLIVSNILGLLPSTDNIGKSLVDGVQVIATWLDSNKEQIVQDVKDIFNWFMNLGQSDFFKEGGILSKLTDLWDQLTKVNSATNTTGFQDLTTALTGLGTAIAGVLDPFLKPFGIALGNSKPSVEGLVSALNSFSKWINDNQKLIQTLLGIFIAFEIIQTILVLIIGFVAALASAILVIAAVVVGFFALIAIILYAITSIGFLTVILGSLQITWIALSVVVGFVMDLISNGFTFLVRRIQNAVADIQTAWTKGDWLMMIRAVVSLLMSGFLAGMDNFIVAVQNAAGRVVDGFRNGFFSQWWGLLSDIGNAFGNMVAFIKGLLGIASPSKVFSEVGQNMIAGVAEGITQATDMAVGAMSNMVAAITVPVSASQSVMQSYMQAAPTSISNTYQSSNSYNLAIHSSANTEPVIQDFNMLQSLAGA